MTEKHPKVITILVGVICLTIIFVVNSFTMKVDNYFAIAIVGIIAWLLGVPVGAWWRRK